MVDSFFALLLFYTLVMIHFFIVGVAVGLGVGFLLWRGKCGQNGICLERVGEKWK